LPANSTQCSGPPWWNGGPPTCTTTSSPTNWAELTIACQTSVHVTLPVDYVYGGVTMIYSQVVFKGNTAMKAAGGNDVFNDCRNYQRSAVTFIGCDGKLYPVQEACGGNPDVGVAPYLTILLVLRRLPRRQLLLSRPPPSRRRQPLRRQPPSRRSPHLLYHPPPGRN
jgi:hypothetical protein